MPTSAVRARKLLGSGKAAVIRRFPFTIILKERSSGEVQSLRLKLDPGSKETGMAIVNETMKVVVFAAVLAHRGAAIKAKLDSRRATRRGRRNRSTRYRGPRFNNRRRPAGWLPPSLQHRVETIMTWVRRFSWLAPITAISQELVRFDLQKIENPEISGIEYQQGTLAGYEARQYLLQKWGHACAYCGVQNVPLEVEHIHPKAKGGTNRVSNLAIACKPCNTRKGCLDVAIFLKGKPDLLKKIEAQAKRPLKDATAVNATRWALYERLQATSLPVETGSGGRTKYNRTLLGLPKEHWIDAACVGESGASTNVPKGMMPLVARAAGHGNRQICATDAFGFPKRHRTSQKSFFGFQTGDMVCAIVPSGKKQGIHTGRLLVRATGSFDIQTAAGRVSGINHRHCGAIHRKDGYAYQ
jgi:5-methylcytosine-specific restriction endonuclease McrA